MLLDALAPRLEKEFGRVDGKYIKRDSGEKAHYTWTLPCRVSVFLTKGAGNADPAVWINREDPHKTPHPLGDWKNEDIRRDIKTSSYDVDEIMDKVRCAVTYNRERMADRAANDQAVTAELEGLAAPTGTSIQRDASTGFYTISYTARREAVSLTDAKTFIRQLVALVEPAVSSVPAESAAPAVPAVEAAQG